MLVYEPPLFQQGSSDSYLTSIPIPIYPKYRSSCWYNGAWLLWSASNHRPHHSFLVVHPAAFRSVCHFFGLYFAVLVSFFPHETGCFSSCQPMWPFWWHGFGKHVWRNSSEWRVNLKKNIGKENTNFSIIGARRKWWMNISPNFCWSWRHFTIQVSRV